MKQFTDYKLFKKVLRKYWKRHAIRRSWYSKTLKKKCTCYDVFTPWCYYLVEDINEFSSKDKLDMLLFEMEQEDVQAFLEKQKELIGKFVKIDNSDKLGGKEVVLYKGLAITSNGVCFALTNTMAETHLYYLNKQMQLA